MILGTAAYMSPAGLSIPAVRHLRETPPPLAPETRTEIVTPATDQPTSFALSPAGRQIVFVAAGDGASRLWLRSLATTDAQPLAGTEGATNPFWSPDGRSLGFFAGTALKRLDLGGGAPDARVRHRGRDRCRDDARSTTAIPPLSADAARWPPRPVLRGRRAGHGRNLPRCA